MTKTWRMVICLTAAALIFTFPAGAQEVKKIGTLDLSKTFDNYEKTKASDSELQGLSQAYQEERDDRLEKMKEAQGKIALLKDEEKAKLESELNTMKEDLKSFIDSKEIDLRRIQDEKIREILLDIEKVVSDFSKKEGYTLILNNRVLIYEDQTLDVTDTIIKILNESYSKQQ